MQSVDVRARLRELFDRTGREAASSAPVIVVWDDPEGEFEELLGELDLPGVEVLQDGDGTRFAVKRRLNELASGEKALLYRRRGPHDIRGDWFADVAMFARHFQADLVSLQLAELGCADTPEMRAALRSHRAPLAKRSFVRRLRALREGFDTPNDLHLAVMAAALGKDVGADFASVIVAFACRARAEGADEALAVLERAGAAKAFGTMCEDATGYAGAPLDVDGLCRHVLFSALSCSVGAARLSGLERWVSAAHAQLCHQIVGAWAADAARAGELEDVAREVEEACNLPARFEALEVGELAVADVFPCVPEVLARKLLLAVADGADVVADVQLAWDARRTMAWFGGVARYYEALVACADLQQLYRAHADGFHGRDARAVWDAYTCGLYQVDAAYRRFHRAFGAALRSPNMELDDALKAAAGRVENLYRNWFLHELDACWLDRAGEDFARRGYAEGVPRLLEFPMSFVEPLARSGRVFVIVSDALRYEVAAELSERLERETKGKTELSSLQAPFPSVTACGMASLLPHGSFSLSCEDGSVSVTLDGMPARSTAERLAVLRARDPSAVAVRQEDFIAMRRDERKALVKDAHTVYVYHNAIDAVGDDAKTEYDVFDACDDAQDEIMALVRVITGELRAASVVITADHGFLYTRGSLEELDHAPAEVIDGTPLKVARRYALAEAGATAPHLASVAMAANGNAGLTGFSPRDCARMRRQGAGERYVHGGISLQELCVPVLRFRNLRAGSAAYVEAEPVEIEPLWSSNLITNTLFRLRFLQTEPVGGKRLACAYELTVEDFSGNAVSDAATVLADKTSEEAAERELSASFALKAGISFGSGQTYFLVARAAETGRIAWRREVRIEVAFAPAEDFGW